MAVRYREIRRRAAELLRRAQIKSAPIDVLKLARILPATVHYEPLDDSICGMIYRQPNGAVIGVNAQHHPNRQRFTIAHEIGHYVLHDEDIHVDRHFPIAFRSANSSFGRDEKEIEANQFAAELLMPENLLIHDVNRYNDFTESEDAVEELARRYKVSVQALTIRLSDLELLSLNIPRART